MMDGARHFSIITRQRKAITAASQRLPTGYAPEENALSMSVRMGDFTNVPGGFPIEVNGEVIGAVAAGGAKIEQDVEVRKRRWRRWARHLNNVTPARAPRASHRARPAPP